MVSGSGLADNSSPEVLCVSDSQKSAARIWDAVVSHRPPECVETTTDPTVVDELAAVWKLECVVADADMQPLDGFDLRSTFQEYDRQPSVIVVSTDPAADEAAVSVVAADTPQAGLAGCLDQAHKAHDDDTALIADPDDSAACRLATLTEADNRCDLVSELDRRLARLPSVIDHQIYLTETDGSLVLTETEASHRARPPVVDQAVETGSPQYAADTAVDSPSANRAETTQTVAYPLGNTGAVVVDLAAFTPAVDARLRRVTTVAGACLDHQTAIDDLEARFHQTAERNRQLSQFARTVSHDLNSPLSVIYGRIELALAEQSDAEMHLQAARNAAQRVDSLITDHLQHIEAAEAENDREEVSIQTVAIQAWRIIDPSTARLQVEPQLETRKANAIRLQQLFENLIRNAIEHGSEESVGLGSTDTRDPHAVFDDDTESVTVTIKPTDRGFAVCDDGPGIPPDERDAIFESGYTTTDSGSGLGLHIVSEIVDSHGWEISVTESEHGGARFEIDTE